MERLGIRPAELCSRLEEELDRRPKVKGAVSEAGKVYVTQRLDQLFVKAADEAARLKDEYVSVEHLLLAFLEEGKSSPSGKLLLQLGADRGRFLKELMAIPGQSACHQRQSRRRL